MSEARVFIWFLVVCIQSHVSLGRTSLGVFSSREAQMLKGFVVDEFINTGKDGMIFYQLASSVDVMPVFYLYLRDDWSSRNEEFIAGKHVTCRQILDKARVSFAVTSLTGNHSIPYLNKPRSWLLVYTDKNTCSEEPISKDDYQIQYNIQFLNPDSIGNPTDHFSGEESGLMSFYQLLVLVFFVSGCIFGPQLIQTLSKRGPMHLVLYLLTGATISQAIDALFMLLHFYRYSNDGIGSVVLETLAEFLDLFAQFLMLHMLLSMSLGWTLSGSHKPSRLDKTLKTKPAAQIVGLLALSQTVLFLWEQFQGFDHKLYHSPDSIAGLSLLFMRVILAALFAGNLLVTIARERSALKRGFYTTFAKNCLLWFQCYPISLLLSFLLPDYYSYKFLTVSVVVCQCVAVVLLYRLFLSRSLYWEVSALSSSLPIKLDKTFSIKIYS